jgi:NAD(P)-dependent dehydrogenase (short-subunit alcohol dehydrogenase family)
VGSFHCLDKGRRVSPYPDSRAHGGVLSRIDAVPPAGQHGQHLNSYSITLVATHKIGLHGHDHLACPYRRQTMGRPRTGRRTRGAVLTREHETNIAINATCAPDLRLDGKVAVITGGGRGIGAATARALAALGAHVIAVDNGVSVEGYPSDQTVVWTVAGEICDGGGSAEAVALDASDFDAVGTFLDAVTQTHGSLDIVVAAAGILRVRPIWEMSSADWDDVLRAHATHTFAMAHHSCRIWRDAYISGNYAGGRLVHMTAATGLVGRPGLGANHSAAKGAIAAMTLELAHEMFPYRVTVNAVCAADVRGRMADHVNAWLPAARADFDPADPANTANVIAYLCTGDGSWITGQIIRIMGGLIGGYRPWSVFGSLQQEQPWQPEQMRVGMRRLFGAYPETKAIHSEHRIF